MARPPRAARPHLASAWRAVLSASRRGAREAVIPPAPTPAIGHALRRALGTAGLRLTAVAGEDGAYTVVYW